MSVEVAIYDLLSNDAAVSALVSTRIYPIYRPQGDPLPAVIFQEISTNSEYSCDGPTGQETSRVQVTSWAAHPNDARDLAAACLAVLDGYKGTAAAQVIQATFVVSRYDILSLNPGVEENREFGKAIDFAVHLCN